MCANDFFVFNFVVNEIISKFGFFILSCNFSTSKVVNLISAQIKGGEEGEKEVWERKRWRMMKKRRKRMRQRKGRRKEGERRWGGGG